MSITNITIRAYIAAERHKVWEYYTHPEHITKWNFAAPSWHCPAASNDLRSGGKYTARMEARDGSFGFDFEAIYDKVIEGEQFSYTILDGRKVSVYFKTKGDNTEVMITFEAEEENSPELQRTGWQAILNNFKYYTETQNTIK